MENSTESHKMQPMTEKEAAGRVCNVARFNGRSGVRGLLSVVAIAESHTYRGTAREMDLRS